MPPRILRSYFQHIIIMLRMHFGNLFPIDQPTHIHHLHRMPGRLRVPQHISGACCVPGWQLFVVDDADIHIHMHAVPRWIVRKQHGTVESAVAVV